MQGPGSSIRAVLAACFVVASACERPYDDGLPAGVPFVERDSAGVLVATTSEYIHIFDRYRGRTLLDHDLNVVDMHRFPADVVETFVTDSDEVVWVGDVPTSASVGHRIHTLGPAGELRSFGGDRSAYLGPSGASPVVTGDTETLWTVDRNTSRVTRWDLSPEPKVGRVFERTVEEFERADPNSAKSMGGLGGTRRSIDGTDAGAPP